MTVYVPAGFSASSLDIIELRVISNLLQQDKANGQQDELARLRNDQAFELGLPQPVIGN